MPKARPKPVATAEGSAPAYLRAETRGWWQSIYDAYVFESHHVALLTGAAEQLDLAAGAREELERAGSVYVNGRVHPAVKVLRDAMICYARLLRELALDVHAEDPRPPGIPAQRWRKRDHA